MLLTENITTRTECRAQITVTLVVGAELLVCGLPSAAEREIVRRNTFENPEFARRVRLGLWTGGTEPTIALWRRTDDGLVLPRGTFPMVISLCQAHGLLYRVEDETIAPPLHSRIVPSGRLYEYQARALNDLLQRRNGLLEAQTGTGKGNIILTVPARLHTPTLVLVHTAELFRQMRERCREWLGVDPGALGAGRWDLQPITIATVQTLAKRDLRDVAGYFGCVLVDECHHAPARSWAAILNQLPARFRYGFTATPWRKDGLQCLMWRTIGPVTARIDPAEALNAGRVIQPSVESIPTTFFFDLLDDTDWGSMISALVRDGERNALIADTVRTRVGPGTRALVLSDRVEHVEILAELLHEFQPVVLTGELGKAQRESAMAAVRAGATLTIATSSLLGEGVDVPGWDILVLATPMAGGPRTLQAVGRVSRAAPGKDRALVLDLVDGNVPALARAHAQRARLYEGVARGAA